MREWRGLLIVVLAIIQVSRTEDKKPSLVIEPLGKEISQPAGQGFVLTCKGDGGKPELFTDMKWLSPQGHELEGSASIQVTREGSSMFLTFIKPAVEDSGSYNCTGMFQSTDSLSASVHINFFQDVTWEDCPTNQALTVNTDATIRCRVSANPPAIVTWSKDDQPLPSERFAVNTSGVTISGVIEKDAGSYSVRAMVTRTGKFHTRTIVVKVNIPPQIVGIEESVEAVEGEETRISCRATGSPVPVYQWFDPSMKDLGKEPGYSVGSDDGFLIIHTVKKEHKGRYTCRARNDAGEDEKIVDLTVIVKPSILVFDNQTAPDQGKAQFECRANGDPPPKMTIRKDNSLQPIVTGDGGVELTTRTENGETVLLLSIPVVKKSDDGLYYCTAENKGGKAERVGHLTVEYSPVMSTPTNKPIEKTWDNNPKNLTCIASAIPNATITWWFKGQEIRGTEKYYELFVTSSESTLMIMPSPELTGYQNVYGAYKCVGKNSHGSADISITLEEARAPDQLLQVNFKKVTPTTITFEFAGPKDDGGLSIKSYVVEYYEEGTTEKERKRHEWIDGISYILENLKPRVAYIFRFAAKNEVGIGRWTDDERRVMPAEAAPAPPQFITPGGNISRYHNKFEVRWTEPQDNGRKIESFQLRYFQVARDVNGWKRVGNPVEKIITKWQNHPKYEITGLEPLSYYKVEVRAINAIGQSADATMIFQTAAGSPEGQPTHPDEGNLPWGVIAVIILAVVLAVLLILDITCYVRYHWGVLYILRSIICGKPDSPEKAKEAAMEDSKQSGKDSTNNGQVKHDAAKDAASSNSDQQRVPIISNEDDKYAEDKVTEDTPMIESRGAKDGKIIDTNNIDIDMKNKSPKGSKSSIAKDSAV